MRLDPPSDEEVGRVVGEVLVERLKIGEWERAVLGRKLGRLSVKGLGEGREECSVRRE